MIDEEVEAALDDIGVALVALVSGLARLGYALWRASR